MFNAGLSSFIPKTKINKFSYSNVGMLKVRSGPMKSQGLDEPDR